MATFFGTDKSLNDCVKKLKIVKNTSVDCEKNRLFCVSSWGKMISESFAYPLGCFLALGNY